MVSSKIQIDNWIGVLLQIEQPESNNGYEFQANEQIIEK